MFTRVTTSATDDYLKYLPNEKRKEGEVEKKRKGKDHNLLIDKLVN